jgi:purine-cytosine permease-like protein
VGLAQWLVLRRRHARAEAWVIANVAAWAVGWSVISLVEEAEGLSTARVYLIGGAGAAAAGMITGIALVWLSRTRTA